jgi:hypothetical protein
MMWNKTKSKLPPGVAHDVIVCCTEQITPDGMHHDVHYEVMTHWPDGTWTNAECVRVTELPEWYAVITPPRY